jgi:pyruvyl transferase EpsO
LFQTNLNLHHLTKGNFGDLWRKRTEYRNYIVRHFPYNHIVFLPQSIFYFDEQIAAQDAVVYRQHTNLDLLVRSDNSLKFADAYFQQIRTTLMPDMAFMIGPQAPNAPPKVDVVLLLRKDKESSFGEQELNEILRTFSERDVTYDILDWFDWENVAPDHLAQPPTDHQQLPLYRLEVGNSLLSRGRVVLTDRLHAVILAILMGKPHVHLDNNYKKIQDFMNTHFNGEGACSRDCVQGYPAKDGPDAAGKVLEVLDGIKLKGL